MVRTCTYIECSYSYSFVILALVVLLLEDEPSRSRELWSRLSSKMSLYIAPLILCSTLTSLSVPAPENQTAHRDAASTMHHCSYGIGHEMSSAWFLLDMTFDSSCFLAFRLNSSVFLSSDQRISFSWSAGFSGAFWETPGRLSCAFN